MRLQVLLPYGVSLDQQVAKVSAEAENGFFTLLPRHIDFVAALVPGILQYVTGDGQEHFLALDEGILVKQADRVFVSAVRAIPGDDLERLRESVEEELKARDEDEQRARSVVARLEVDTLRRFSRFGGDA